MIPTKRLKLDMIPTKIAKIRNDTDQSTDFMPKNAYGGPGTGEKHLKTTQKHTKTHNTLENHAKLNKSNKNMLLN